MTIYRGEFENLPKEVIDKLNEVDKLITKANQAAVEEKEGHKQYRELIKNDHESPSLHDQYEAE